MARQTDRKAKEKKQKIMLGALGVVLLGVLAFQLPTLLKSGTSATTAPVTTTTTTAPTSALPAGQPAPSAAPANSSEVVFSPSVAKLATLDRFRLKDPFDTHGAAGAETASATAAPAPAAAPAVAPPTVPKTTPAVASAGSSGAAGKTAGPVFGTVQGSSGGASTKSGVPSVTIRVNGKTGKVSLGGTFPQPNPFFQLAGVRPGSLIVTLVSGSLADGSSFLDLVKGKPVTLVDTKGGRRFTIEFLSVNKAT